MRLFTEVDIPEYPFKINYKDALFFAGSCFVENIGGYLEALNLPVIVNPFGIVYNPESIAHQMEMILQGKRYTEKDLIQKDNGLWFHYDFHGSFSELNAAEVLQTMNSSLEAAQKALKKARYFFFTFGTAWIYLLRENGQTVSNCHKMPATLFERKRLEVEEITSRFTQIIQQIKRINPEARFIFTISPVRHMKDGAIENMLSKAVLKVAVHHLIASRPDCYYFPAFEIMYDELRDYRFYEKDLIHLNDTAKEIILEKFLSAFYNSESRTVIDKLKKINKSVLHRPLFLDSPEHQAFLEKLETSITNLEKETGLSLEKFRQKIKYQ